MPQHLSSAEKPMAGFFSETLQSPRAFLSWNGAGTTLPQNPSTVFCLAFHALTTTLMEALPSLFPKYDTFFCLQVQRKGSNTLPSMLLKRPKQASQTSARTYCKCFQTPAESTVTQGFFLKHSNYTIWLYLHRQGHAVLQHRVQQSLIAAKFFVQSILRVEGKWKSTQ